MSAQITPREHNLLRRMIAKEAVIFDNGTQGILPIHPRGDRRTKPMGWIDRACFLRLRGSGDIVKTRGHYAVAKGTAARLSNPAAERAHSEQHLGRQDKDIYTPAAVVRTVRISKTGGSLRRLARKKHGDGTPLLSPAMVEAGERFARDYARVHGGDITTQNYAAPMVSGGSNPGARASDKMAARIDGAKRLAAATAAMGPGLDRVVTAICCNDYDLAQLERDEKWAVRSGMVVLQMGLSRLVEFYGTVPGVRATKDLKQQSSRPRPPAPRS